jgi:hypothetical protein
MRRDTRTMHVYWDGLQWAVSSFDLAGDASEETAGFPTRAEAIQAARDTGLFAAIEVFSKQGRLLWVIKPTP